MLLTANRMVLTNGAALDPLGTDCVIPGSCHEAEQPTDGIGTHIDLVIQRADAALYRAKAQGRNRAVAV